MTKKVCVVKGDDACPEVVVPAVHILEGMGLDIEFLWTATNDEALAKYGEVFPDSARQAIDKIWKQRQICLKHWGIRPGC